MKYILLIYTLICALLLTSCRSGSRDYECFQGEPIELEPSFTFAREGSIRKYHVESYNNNISYSGWSIHTISDGGTINGCDCLLSTLEAYLTCDDQDVDPWQWTFKEWFYQDSTGYYVTRIQDFDGEIIDVGSYGRGVLSSQQPFGMYDQWINHSGDTVRITGAVATRTPAGTFNCYRVETNIDDVDMTSLIDGSTGITIINHHYDYEYDINTYSELFYYKLGGIDDSTATRELE